MCFGIASFDRPRIECVDPLGSAEKSIGQGEIGAPVGSALAYVGGDLWATDQYGGAYAFVASSGALAGRNTSAALTGGGLSIAPPAVDLASGQVFVVADGYGSICSLQARGNLAFWPGGPAASCFSAAEMQGAAGQFTAPTVTSDGGACATVWDAANSGQLGASDLCSGKPPVEVDVAMESGGQGHNFSAVVVGVGPGSRYLVMWSDTAVTYYQGGCGGCLWSNNPNANYAAAPAGGNTGSGLEVWDLAPPLDAWLVGAPVTAPPAQGVPSGGECVFAVTSPGATFTGVTYSDAYQKDVPMRVVPGRQSVNPPGLAGCPSPPRGSGDYAALNAEWGTAPQPGLPAEANGTTAPSAWEGGMEFWEAGGVVAPAGRDRLPITVTATTPQGGTVSTIVDLYTNCPQGDSTAGAAETCVAPAPAPPNAGAPYDNCGNGHQACPPPYTPPSGTGFTAGPHCIPATQYYPGFCKTYWLTNPSDPPVCGRKPIGGNKWNPAPGCIVDSAGVIRDPNVPGGWAILPDKEFTPTCKGFDLPNCHSGRAATG